MYGIINQSIQALIMDSFGAKAWQRTAELAGLPDVEFLTMRNYDDSQTNRIVAAAVDVLGLPPETLLESFGRYWITTAERGYGDLLRFTGSNFLEFCQNLDAMHARLKISFPELRPPSFRCRQEADGTILIHYRSERPGLGPIVTGMLHGIAIRLGITLEIEARNDASDGNIIYQVRPSGPGAWLSAEASA